jgi:hypothetical protein
MALNFTKHTIFQSGGYRLEIQFSKNLVILVSSKIYLPHKIRLLLDNIRMKLRFSPNFFKFDETWTEFKKNPKFWRGPNYLASNLRPYVFIMLCFKKDLNC